VVVEKDGEDQFVRSCEKLKNIGKNQGGEKYPTTNKKLKVMWFGCDLCRDCILEHFMEGNIE
jgi:hypothetical protein